MKQATITPDPADSHFSIVTVYSRGRVVSSHYILTADTPVWRNYSRLKIVEDHEKKIKGSAPAIINN